MISIPEPEFKRFHDTPSGCGNELPADLEPSARVTAVRYGAMQWLGEFKYKPNINFKCGAKVVVQTDRGIELGQQVSLVCPGCNKSISREQVQTYVEQSGMEFYRLNSGRILREATEQDLDEHRRLNAPVQDDVDDCALVAARLNLDMKIITAEHLLGGERIVFYFRAESRVDFRQLVRELAQRYQTRIEMRQVGARDEARLVADYEVCGRECCCKSFLKKLRPVSMKMAKLQKSTLDPSKVSGRCGRLRCCLRYEHDGYETLLKRLPRIGSYIGTDEGPATVVSTQVLTQLVQIRTDDQRELVIPVEEVREFNLPRPKTPPPPPKESAPTKDKKPSKDNTETRADTDKRPTKRRRGGERRRPPRPRTAPDNKQQDNAEEPTSAFIEEKVDRQTQPTETPDTTDSVPAAAEATEAVDIPADAAATDHTPVATPPAETGSPESTAPAVPEVGKKPEQNTDTGDGRPKRRRRRRGRKGRPRGRPPKKSD